MRTWEFIRNIALVTIAVIIVGMTISAAQAKGRGDTRRTCTALDYFMHGLLASSEDYIRVCKRPAVDHWWVIDRYHWPE